MDGQRRCPIESNKPFEDSLNEIEKSFGIDWLNSNSGHPLQELWSRKDILSSIELFTLGSSISHIKPINSNIVKENVNIIKTNDRNGRRGAVFEMVIASALHNPPEQTVELLDPQYPLYDMIVHFNDKTSINISVKNFGQSDKGELFMKEAKLVEQIIKINLKLHARIFIKCDIYPSLHEWDILQRQLPIILKNISYSGIKIYNWYIFLLPHEIDESKLYDKQASYTLLITAPFYRNEKIRLFSKLNEACTELKQKGNAGNKNIGTILYAHIPAYISIKDYYDWCSKYLAENPDAPISSIRLIQPAYAVEEKDDFTHLFILYRDITKNNNDNGFIFNNNRLINRFPVGINAGKQFESKFGKGSENMPIEHYWYQSGHIYLFDDSRQRTL